MLRLMKIELPSDMDVPLKRRDTTKPDNVRWLLRNLLVRNRQHPDIDTVLSNLRQAAKSS
jgi:hypothetical protein